MINPDQADGHARVMGMLRYQKYFKGTRHETSNEFIIKQITVLGLNPGTYDLEQAEEPEEDEDFPEAQIEAIVDEEPATKKSAVKKST